MYNSMYYRLVYLFWNPCRWELLLQLGNMKTHDGFRIAKNAFGNCVVHLHDYISVFPITVGLIYVLGV